MYSRPSSIAASQRLLYWLIFIVPAHAATNTTHVTNAAALHILRTLLLLLGYQCKVCTPRSQASVITVLVLLSTAALIGAVLLVRHLLGIQSKSKWSAILHSKVPPKVSQLLCRLRDAPYGKLRVPLVVLQILTQFVSITGLPLPPLYYKFVRWVSAVNVSIEWLMPSGCLIEMNFHQQLLVVTLVPL
eukprot:1428-Heterococcus_DN1.PRE.1